MNPTNEQEIIETILSILGIVDRTSGNRPEQIAVLEQEITAHINAEIAKVMDRLTAGISADIPNYYDQDGWEVAMKHIQAERAKLKEVK